MSKSKKLLGNRVRQMRKRDGLSQEEFVAKHPVVKFDPANEDKLY